MKIAITAHGDDCRAQVDSRFGRAGYFMIYDQEAGTWSALENSQNLTSAHGAGIQAGQNVAREGVSVVITGHVGPKAFKVLHGENIAMYSFGELEGSVEETLQAFNAGQLKRMDVANALEVK